MHIPKFTKALLSNVGVVMATDIPCDSCLYDETNQNARKWCTSCKEFLCKECEKTHKKNKSTRDHQLISIDDYRKIENVPIFLTCSDHDKKLEWFCRSHDKALCVVCLPTEHGSCSDVIPIDEHTTNVDIKELKIEQAQMQLNVQPSRNVADVELQLITKVEIKRAGQICITGCAILPNGHLLFANYTHKQNLLEYSEVGNYIGSIQVSALPYDITVLDSDRIAITYGSNGFFEIFNYRNKRVEKKINTAGHCWILSQSNGKIYVKLDKIMVFDITGEKLRTFSAEGNLNISAAKNNLFCSSFLKNKVCCYDMKGQELWKFQDDSLDDPYGIANDPSGNVFVVGRTSKNLILIQHDGKTYKRLLNFKEISNPQAVSYNKDNNTLLYSDESGYDCALYKVLYK
ncbi:unnamed protein product [Mytilus coruscus]|uniref:B box-type domain-containing protein n=1 Tax=Mytilus coruscus TaxID=42192 RepID=A0A6J8EGG1_MYTCO|nr:unnamed protein product [Mytilus coruscus]